MAKLFYVTDNGRFFIKEAMLDKESLDGFYELFGEDEINNTVLNVAGEYPFRGAFHVYE